MICQDRSFCERLKTRIVTGVDISTPRYELFNHLAIAISSSRMESRPAILRNTRLSRLIDRRLATPLILQLTSAPWSRSMRINFGLFHTVAMYKEVYPIYCRLCQEIVSQRMVGTIELTWPMSFTSAPC